MQPPRSQRWLPLLIFGLMLNTIGVSLIGSSPAGYVFMVVGLASLLAAVLVSMHDHSPSDP